MSERPDRPFTPPRRRRLEAWLVTGPAGHALGGGLDVLEAVARYWIARLRGRPPG